MNPHEHREWAHLCSRISRLGRIDKDPEADVLLRYVSSAQPNALYYLANRVVALEHALLDAADETASLERQIRHEREASNLGTDVCWRIFGSGADAVESSSQKAAAQHFPPRQPPID
jgi:hypothetical protein